MTGKRTAGGRPRSEGRALMEAAQETKLRRRVRDLAASHEGFAPDQPWPELDAALDALTGYVRSRALSATRGRRAADSRAEVPRWLTST